MRSQDGTGPSVAPLAEPGIIAVVGEALDWRAELGGVLGREGYAVNQIAHLDAVRELLAAHSVRAIFMAANPLAASDLLLLRRIRETSPRTAVVVVTKTPTDPDLKRAFESGATSFLSWPAPPEAVRQAIDRGSPDTPAKSRPSTP